MTGCPFICQCPLPPLPPIWCDSPDRPQFSLYFFYETFSALLSWEQIISLFGERICEFCGEKKNHSLEHPFPSFHWPRLTIWAAKSCSTGHSCPCLYRRGVWIQETLPPISVLGILKESGHLFLGQRHLAHQRPWTQTAHLSGQPICLWGKVRVLF